MKLHDGQHAKGFALVRRQNPVNVDNSIPPVSTHLL